MTASPTFTLLKDIHAEYSFSDDVGELLAVGNTLYIVANDGTHGSELWKSDGTEAGTVLLKDVYQGVLNVAPHGLRNVNGTLYFQMGRNQIWKTDGTEEGTVQVVDMTTFRHDAQLGLIGNAGETVYFNATGQGVDGLWKTDGTPAGTTLVKRGLSASQWIDFNGTLFFIGSTVGSDREVWKSDGTEAGTVMLKDIRPGSQTSYPSGLMNVGGTLYFRANSNAAGHELWRSDGTEVGTVMVKDVRPGVQGGVGQFISVGETIYFSGDDGVNGPAIWKSDGTSDGTLIVKPILYGNLAASPGDLINVDGTVFFTAYNGYDDYLWKSDGTAAGTIRVPNSPRDPKELANVGGVLYFNGGAERAEPWTSDGTAAGTYLLQDLRPGDARSLPRQIVQMNDLVFLVATTNVGDAVWVSKLTPERPADFDFDDEIDGADFLEWQRQLGKTVNPAGIRADADENGIVDAGDLTLWAANFGVDAPTSLEDYGELVGSVESTSLSNIARDIVLANDLSTLFYDSLSSVAKGNEATLRNEGREPQPVFDRLPTGNLLTKRLDFDALSRSDLFNKSRKEAACGNDPTSLPGESHIELEMFTEVAITLTR